MKMLVVLLVISMFVVSSCARIPLFSKTPIVPDTNHIYVTFPAPDNVKTYDPSLADQWERTLNFCAQREQALSTEIDSRSSRLSNITNNLLLVGGVAALSTAIYSGIAKDPKKEVIIPLSTISGGSLISALPGLSSDDRLNQLKDKYEQVKSTQAEAKKQMDDVDNELVKYGILKGHFDKVEQKFNSETDPSKKQALETDMNKKQLELDGFVEKVGALTSKLRGSMERWEILLR